MTPLTRNLIYKVLESEEPNLLSRIYNVTMVVMIFASLLPLVTRHSTPFLETIEWGTTMVFLIEYFIRWSIADKILGKGKKSFILYPLTAWALVDILSIIPTFNILSVTWFGTFKLFRLSRFFRIVRVFKFFRYSSKLNAFLVVLRKERSILLAVLMIALLYIFITALIMFNVEPEVNPATGQTTFPTFFEALYWSTVTLTTVGYGDICPVTEAGRIISMLSSLFGVAIIALPSGVITASYMEELRNEEESKRKLE